MSARLHAVLALLLAVLAPVLVATPANAAPAHAGLFGVDCTDSPTPAMPGQGLAAFFESPPKPLPPQADPFAPHAKTSIFEQYGFAGLEYHTYDLGCGPDAARQPDAVIGTAISNWMLQIPIALTALTTAVTRVAFQPTFLNVFDPTIAHVSTALHRSLFATWVPAVLALLGVAILIRARRSALATTAAAIGWALMVVVIATALFRWPVAAGHVADGTVTSSLGSVVRHLDGNARQVPPSVAVASNVQQSIFYKSWLAGELGSTTSHTARKYGPELFKAQALTWHQAHVVEHNPDRGKEIIQAKEARWKQVAAQVKDTDPSAYEYLTGKQSGTRVGYAILSSVGAILALPFLLVAALLLLGSFLIVRLAVMLFPAFATLGVFPAGRGLVTGIGRTVGAALINAVIFGVGAAVTIRVLGLILDPASRMPAWLSLVLMPLFGLIMWVALKPFRRLTTMVSPQTDPFGDGAGAVGHASRSAGRFTKRAAGTLAAAYTAGAAGAAAAGAVDDDDDAKSVPDRAEAYSGPPTPPSDAPRALPTARAPRSEDQPPPMPPKPEPGPAPSEPGSSSSSQRPLPEGYVPTPTAEGVPLPPTEPEWVDGEEVYAIYRPSDDSQGDDAA